MTRRQDIIELLEKQKITAQHLEKQKITAQHLANIFETTLNMILEDLTHIEKSIKPKKLRTIPAYCKSCNFVFRERSRVSKPSKCPRCRSEWIEAQMFYIE